MSDKPIVLAAITGAHGISGEVRLKLFGDGLNALRQHKSFNDGAFTLTKLRDDSKGGAIARLAQATNRTEAEALRGTALAVSRDALPPLADGEYYHVDLLGLPAVTASGEALGEVIAVQNYGAGDVIEIKRANGKTFMVPMRIEAVPEWDRTRLMVNADFIED